MVRAAALIFALALAGPSMAQTTNCSQFGRTVTCRTAPDMAATAQAQMQQQTRDQQADLDTMMARTAQAPRSSSPSGPIDPRNVTPKACNFFELHVDALPAALCEARAVAEKRKGVGDLLAAGKCDDALKAALATGDLTFAREVRDFCTAPARLQQ